MNELVSVVITTYGRVIELERAIKSVINQTYKELEIIVVDDNVDESISEKVKEIINNIDDNRIILIKNEKNLGGALSRNAGIENSHGNFIAFLDDDDEYLPAKIERQLELFKKTNDSKLALVYCYCNGIKNGRMTKKYCYNYVGNCLYESMLMCIAATSQWMCKRESLLDVEMFSDVPCKQDSTVIIKLLSKGYTIDRVPEVLSLYHDEDIPRISSKNAKKRIVGENLLLDLCRENYDKIDKKQQQEVEYNFSCILVLYYYEIGDLEKYKKNMKDIIMIHGFSKKSFKIYFYIFKKKIKKMINIMKLKL